MNDKQKEYQRQYHVKNRERIKEQRKQYRKRNALAIRENKRLYGLRPEVKQKKKERSAELYLRTKDKVKKRQSARRKERKEFLDRVSLHYGCSNPDCKWTGCWEPSQLDFHHLNPQEKIIEVAKMESWSFVNIVSEINKCVVLCRNCHALVHLDKANVDKSMLCKVNQNLEITK